MTVRERNRVWTSDDLRALHIALRTTESIAAAAKGLDRDPPRWKGWPATLDG